MSRLGSHAIAHLHVICEDVEILPLPVLLAPFFAIIRSPLSTGPITSAALSALHNFFVCGLISVNSTSLESVLVELSSTVSHCKFEASDSSGDEVVLLKIMTVIQDCMCDSGVQTMLGDVEVCEMLETVLTTCCQMRLSGRLYLYGGRYMAHLTQRPDTLRRSAETTMHALVRSVFARLHTLDPVVEEKKVQATDEDVQDSEIKMIVSSDHTPVEADSRTVDDSQTEEPVIAPLSPTTSGPRSQCMIAEYFEC